jgi:hypothetical protein
LAKRHQKKAINDALDYAEDKGWSVEPKPRSKGHAWGRVVSPDGTRKIRIDKTPRSPEGVAKDIRRAVERYARDREK